MAEKHHSVPARPAKPAERSGSEPGSTVSTSGTGPAKPLHQSGLLIRSAAEAFGAFVLILGGVSISMFGGQTGIPGALAFGLLFVAAIIAVGHVSGGHFNPALTLGFAFAGRLSWKDVLPYIIAQVIGGVAAMGLLWVVLSGGPPQIVEQIEVLFGSVSSGYGQNSPSQFPLTSVLLLVVILTAVLMGIYLGATSSRANKALAPFAAGLTYAAVLQVALPISGGGLNPARATATVLFGEAAAAGQLWLFWVAPLAGAAIAGLIARSFEPAPADNGHDGSYADETTVATTGTTAATAGTADRGASVESTAPESPAGGAPVGGPIVEERDGNPYRRSEENPDHRNENDARDFFDGKDKK